MPQYFVDLHIHIGATQKNQPVKITASRKLTFFNIIEECVKRKGLNAIGIVDCASPGVQEDIKYLMDKGHLFELNGGGFCYQNKITIIPGVEVESNEDNGGRGHYVSFFPTFSQLSEYSKFLTEHIKNINLSTQQSYLPARKLLETTKDLGGIFFPAHAFTPHRSLFGSCGNSLQDVFLESTSEIKILELGLSSDTDMADRIYHLHGLTYLTNSDAHSLEKIGREYNLIEMTEASFRGLVQALYREKGKIIANYGLNPKLGKYHRNFCENCQKPIELEGPLKGCPWCSEFKITKGVLDRVLEIGNLKSISPEHRPPYIYQVPLNFLPKVGKKTIDKLIENFGSEMNVLHNIPRYDLAQVVGSKTANLIELSRKGKLSIAPGGGGIYGKVIEG